MRVSKGPARGLPVRAAAVLVGVVCAVAAAGFLLLRDRPPGADDVLADVRAALADATSFRFNVHTVRDPDPADRNSIRFSDQGLWAHGVWKLANQSYETLVDAEGRLFTRVTEPGGDGAWDAHGRVDGDALLAELLADWRDGTAADRAGGAGGAVPPAVAGALDDRTAVNAAIVVYLTGDGFPAVTDTGWALERTAGAHPHVRVGGAPTTFLHALTELGRPELLSHGSDRPGDGVALAATVTAPDEAVEAFGRPLPAGRVELYLGDGDLPTALRLDVAGDVARTIVTIRFSDWNEPVVIAPPGDDLDRTPWAEEAELTASGVEAVAPPDLLAHDGFRARAVPALFLYGNGPIDCDALVLSDGPLGPGVPAASTRWLVELTQGCAAAFDASPFSPGGPAGLPHRRVEGGTLQVLVGDTVVEPGPPALADDPTALATLVAALRPVTPADLLAAAADEPAGWTPFESIP